MNQKDGGEEETWLDIRKKLEERIEALEEQSKTQTIKDRLLLMRAVLFLLGGEIYEREEKKLEKPLNLYEE